MYKIFNNNSKKIQIINENKNYYPFVISIPHSGILITEKMKNNLIKNVILANMDWYLPQLYSFLEDMGFTVIINNVSRYVIDPNRDLEYMPEASAYNSSLIYTKTTFNRNIYNNQLLQEEMKERINEFYIPYHKEIEKQIKEKSKFFNKVYLIDLHSFGKNIGADIVLGNNIGQTTSKDFFYLIKNEFEKNGFKTNDNTPYKGGYITRHYRETFDNCETLQIELWYGTYIENREFGEEYQPKINEILFRRTTEKIINIFECLREKL